MATHLGLTDAQVRELEDAIRKTALSITGHAERILGDADHPQTAMLSAYIALTATLCICEATIASAWVMHNGADDESLKRYADTVAPAVSRRLTKQSAGILLDLMIDAMRVAGVPIPASTLAAMMVRKPGGQA